MLGYIVFVYAKTPEETEWTTWYYSQKIGWTCKPNWATIYETSQEAEDAVKVAKFWDGNEYRCNKAYIGHVIFGSHKCIDIPGKAFRWWIVGDKYKCPECKNVFDEPYNYCPSCGMRMLDDE